MDEDYASCMASIPTSRRCCAYPTHRRIHCVATSADCLDEVTVQSIRETFRKLISEAVTQGNVSDASLRAYMLGTADVFLLDDELSKYLDALGKRAAILQPLNLELESLPVGSERRIELSKQRGEELAWWNDRAGDLVAHFKPLLRLPRIGMFDCGS
jgi:hypothetical protein